MTKITFLGSCREVGRSGILIEANSGSKVMLDYGIRFRGKKRLPEYSDLEDLKAVALTHCHVDHSGAIPALYKNHTMPFFTNQITLEIIEVLIKDTLRISNFPYPFGYPELEKMIQNAYFLNNETRHKIDDDFHITFYNAGHVPGSVSILLEVDGKKILYTGDMNSQKTNLVHSANPTNIPAIDVLITESTYSQRTHPSREEIEKRFVENIIDKIENGGKVLIPAFGVARSQEALMILEKYNYKGKIYIDGMARKICDVYLNYPNDIKNIDSYKKSLKKAQFIRKKGRNEAKRSNAAIIAPSGMLKGGASITFVKSFINDPTAAIYLVGYQAEGSPGRKLLEDGVFEYRERDSRRQYNDFSMVAKCDTEYFNFSSHADGFHLHEYIEKLTINSKNIFCVHGDNKSVTAFSSELADKGYTSVAPETGEIYKI